MKRLYWHAPNFRLRFEFLGWTHCGLGLLLQLDDGYVSEDFGLDKGQVWHLAGMLVCKLFFWTVCVTLTSPLGRIVTYDRSF